MHRRPLLAASFMLLAARARGADRWSPDRPLRLVAPFAAGGASDLIARLLAEALTPQLGQTVLVENRTGAGGAVGTEAVVRARPDGLTLLLGSQATHATGPALSRLGFDPNADLAAIGGIAGVPAVMVVHPGVQAATVAEFTALARARSGAITYGSAGIGASTHLAGALYAHLAGVTLTHVPYRGTAPAMADLVAGRIDMMCDTLPTALPHLRDGRIRALGVSTRQRSTALPDVPTIAEAGVAGYEALNWYGLYAPAATPPAALARLAEANAAVLADAAFRTRLEAQGMPPFDADPAALRAYAIADRGRWATLVRDAGITAAN